jgi:cytochrome c553
VRNKLEIRNPKLETSSRSQIRISNFGFVSSFEFRVSNFIPAITLILLVLLTCSCRRDMFNQPSTQPLSRNDFFQDNQMASRPLVMHTVARGQLQEDEAFYTGKIGTNLVTTFPMPITRELLERGRERFDIYCSVCHGRTGGGNGMIVQRGFPVPPSYHIDRLRQAPVGHFFDVMTQGYGIMYSYAERVKPEDRWAIAAYIRALQLSQNMKLAELPSSERAKLEVSK